jgi:hypothetical protein
MTYSDKLKDPRWQRKRLEIMERDQFTCVLCGSKTKSLNVHHIAYHRNEDPWMTNRNLLITMCEDCHKVETNARNEGSENLISTLYALGFSQANMFGFGEAISQIAQSAAVTIDAMGDSIHLEAEEYKLLQSVVARASIRQLFLCCEGDHE